jgi:hypothetical protein
MTDKPTRNFFLPGRLASRWADYLSDLQALTMQGTTEPRRYIGCMEEFWLRVTSDHAEWLRQIGYGDEATPGTGLFSVQEFDISPDYPVATINMPLPPAVFDHFESDKIVLYPSPLECRGTVFGYPGTNVRIVRPNVTRGDSCVALKVYDLGKLQSGMELRGVVWAAEETRGARRLAPIVICSVCLRVT